MLYYIIVDMVYYTCPKCIQEPNSHSLEYYKIENDVIYFYTCPANALYYDDHKGIMEHYEGMFTNLLYDNQMKCKKWCWIFDCQGFQMKHYMQIQTAIEIAKLISQPIYANSLQTIYVYKPTYFIRLTLAVIYPFLSDNIKSKIILSR